MSDNWIENLKYDAGGLIPAIAQDHQDGTVLMVAWMNRQALELTVSTGEIHYWSRSRQELWHKGGVIKSESSAQEEMEERLSQ